MAISTSFSTALSGLKSHQVAIDVTSENISNASNPDYVRQRAVFSSLPSINSTPGDIGTGVKIDSIDRITDTFLFNRYTSTSADYSNLDTQEKYLKEIATYFPDVTDNGLYKDMQDFFNAWQTFASNPNDDSVKVDLAAKTENLTDNIHSLESKLKDLQKNINDSIKSRVDEANGIIKQIADLNKQINEQEANGESHANDLRDKRDSLEKRLKEIMDVSVYKTGVTTKDAQGETTTDYAKDYQISIGGYPIVDNSTYHELTLNDTLGNTSIGIEKDDHSVVDITKDIKGGEIGGLLSIRGNDFNSKGEPTDGALGNLMSSLNALAGGLIRSVNSLYSYSAQESVQTDTINKPVTIPDTLANKPLSQLNNILKTPVTNGKLALNVYDDKGNYTKTLDIQISPDTQSINDVIKNINDTLTNNGVDNVEAKLVNGQLKFVNTSDGSESSKVLVKDDGARLFNALNQIEYLPLNSVNNTDLPMPLKNGSFDLDVYNNDGDVLAKRTITVNMDSSDPRYSTLAGIAAQINTPAIDDNNDNNQNDDVDDYYQAKFLNGQFTLSKKTDQNTYVGLDNDTADFGGSLGINKFFDGTDASTIQLKQSFQEDSSLIKASKTPNSGDNTIANNILQLQYENVNFYQNGQTTSSTIYGYYKDMTSSLANETQNVSNNKDTTQTLLNNIKNEYYSLSGVNVDEELINLEKYQRGYQANARVVTTINKMLDSLFAIQ